MSLYYTIEHNLLCRGHSSPRHQSPTLPTLATCSDLLSWLAATTQARSLTGGEVVQVGILDSIYIYTSTQYLQRI